MRAFAILALLLIACGPSSPSAPPPASAASATRVATSAPTVAAASPRLSVTASPTLGGVTMKEFPVPAGSGPHDVAPATDGGVWFTAQRSGQLGWLDPKTGQTKMIPLGAGSAPHGVIVGPDGAPWITDGGLNAIVRVDPRSGQITRYGLPGQNVNLNTAVFDTGGVLWFTGQSGVVGSVNRNGSVDVWNAPKGAGPYGITSTPSGDVYFASLAASYVGRVDPADTAHFSVGRSATVVEPPTAGQGARRVWADSKGMIWVSEWNAGQLGRYDPRTNTWKEWKLPGTRPQAYAVFVDDRDIVWLSEWSASAIVRFDPATETFTSFPHAPGGSVRQLHGRPGEVWGALSTLDKLLLIMTR